LKGVSEFGTIYAFTTVQKKIADLILDELDPKGLIKHRYYQETLSQTETPTLIPVNPKKLVLVVSSEESSQKQQILKSVLTSDPKAYSNIYKKNTIKLSEWSNDNRFDKELSDCLEIIEQLSFAPDVSKDLKFIAEHQFSQLN